MTFDEWWEDRVLGNPWGEPRFGDPQDVRKMCYGAWKISMLEEREACAKIAEEWNDGPDMEYLGYVHARRQIAKKIRARKE